VSLTPTIYSSSDAGAPQMTGQAGAMVNLLRALLVTGYGAGGSAKPALGWTEEFTGVNKAVFRNAPVTGSGYRLRVLDDGSAAAGGDARSASLCGFSMMSDIDTGNDPTPTSAQFANGAVWPKSTVASSTARAWWAIGNERCVYLFIDIAGGGLALASPYFAGDLISFKAGDGHHFMISVAPTTWTGSGTASRIFCASSSASSGASPGVSQGLVIGRSYSGAVGSVFVAPSSHKATGGLSTPFGGSGLVYPSPVSGGLFYDTIVVHEGGSVGPRGVMPGVYVPLHALPLADLAELANPDGLALGRVLVAKRFRGDNPTNVGNNGELLFDRVGGW
jgi:hypothetical protein